MANKDNIILSLVNFERNMEMLKAVPHAGFLDLAVIYRVVIAFNDGGMGTVLVNNGMMEDMGLTKEGLHKTAYENSLKLYPAAIKKLTDRLYMASNEPRLFGAAAILFPEVLESLQERIKGSFYIMPSSIHEVMAASAKEDPEYLLDVLKEANGLYVGKNESLSDNIYLYDAAQGELGIYKNKGKQMLT